MYYLICANEAYVTKYTLLLKKVNWSRYIKRTKKCWSGRVNSTPIFLYNNPHVIQCCFELMCFTYWIVFHFESSFCSITIRMKLNQDLIVWWDSAVRNWITAILSQHIWCTWITIINGQEIIAETNGMVFFSHLIIMYKVFQLTCSSRSTLHQRIKNWFLLFVPIVLESAKSSQGCRHNFQETQVMWWHHLQDNCSQNRSLCLHS